MPSLPVPLSRFHSLRKAVRLPGALLVLTSGLFAQGRFGPGFEVYRQYCGTCHGSGMQGARAPALNDGNWKYGGSDVEIARVISEGVVEAGMPGFGSVLSGEEIGGIVRLMRQFETMRQGRADESKANTHENPRASERMRFRLESVADELEIPWSFDFLPDGGLIVSERPGALRFIHDGVVSPPVAGTPEPWVRQDGGYFALALDPDYATNGWIYLSFSEAGAELGTSMTKLVRGRVRDHRWVDEEIVWAAPPALYTESNIHYGCRLLFHDGLLYFSLGDHDDRPAAQDLGSQLGKIHRVNPDGTAAAGNPFANRPGALATIWSYGHRNPQGLVITADGTMWSSEHGPMGGDEINRIEPGANYGWPLTTHGLEHTGEKVSEHTSLPGMEDPATVYVPSIATTGMAVAESARYPAWADNLFLGSMVSQELIRLEVVDDQIVHQESLLKGVGRVRDLRFGPDGLLYVSIERFGRTGEIVRLLPLE